MPDYFVRVRKSHRVEDVVASLRIGGAIVSSVEKSEKGDVVRFTVTEYFAKTISLGWNGVEFIKEDGA